MCLSYQERYRLTYTKMDLTNKDNKVVVKVLQAVGNAETPDSTAVTVVERNGAGYVTEAKGTTVPTDAEAGFAKGCMFVDTNASAGSILYVNEGDETSCDFNPPGSNLPSGSVADAELATANVGTKTVRTATATADGLTTGALTAGTQFVTVTSANAAHIVTLPAAVAGTVVDLYVGANGCEVRTVAASNVKINNEDSDGTKQAAIPANTLARFQCVSATDWLLTALNNLGAVVTAIVPD